MFKHYVVEKTFKHEGLECAILFCSMGHRCGYVAVEKDSPLFGIDYSDDLKRPELLKELKQTNIGKRGIIPVLCWDGKSVSPEILFNVHGGLTYSGKGCYPVTRPKELWWFGFDCAHVDDAKDLQGIMNNFPEKQWKNSYIFSPEYTNYGTVKTLPYVEQECKNLAEQIRCIESVY